MRTLFTIHAGEFLVASEIKRRFPGVDVWIPLEDKGLDLLVTNPQNGRSVSLQVKFSRSYLGTMDREPLQRERLIATTWWTPLRRKILGSQADLWVLVLHALAPRETQFVVIAPQELAKRLSGIHGAGDRIQSYLWVTTQKRCWETRGLSQSVRAQILNHTYENEDRDFTQYLNAWEELRRRLGREVGT